MCDRTKYLSYERERTAVTEMGLKSLGRVGFNTFGMGVMTAVFSIDMEPSRPRMTD